MAEFKLRINDFLGKNTKFDPLDYNKHEAQTLDSFEVSTKPGALVKRKGFTDQADVILPASYPANWTIKNFFQFRVGKPSAKQIMMVHAQVSGEDRIYVDYTYSGGAWVQGWVELTENEESLDITSSADTTHFVCEDVSSDTNDYYNEWYVFNWTRRIGSLVSDYVGSTNTFTLKTAIAGMAASDLISMYRFPMIVNYEGGASGYTAHTDTDATQIYDIDSPTTTFYKLQQNFDDAYNGWTIWNTTRSDTQSITDFESLGGDDKQKLIHGSITGQVEDDVYFVYKPTRTLEVDDKILFNQRPNTCIMALGSTYRYPKQFPLWYGYIRDTYFFGNANGHINEGYYLEPATLDAPHDEIFTATTQVGDLSIDDTTMYFCLAYIYDGYQVGPLTGIERSYTQAVSVSTDGDESPVVILSIGYSIAPNMRHSRTMNKRVTGIILYGSTDLDVNAKTATWHRLTHLPIRDDLANSNIARIPYGRNHTQVVEREPFGSGRGSTRTSSSRTTITAGGRSTRTSSSDIRIRPWTGTDPFARSISITNAMWSNKSDYYTLDSGGMNGDIPNYLYRADSTFHSITGNIFLDKNEASLIVASPFKDNGTPSPDFFPLINLHDMASYNITHIYGIEIINDYVYILGDSKSLRMLLGSGLSPAFKLDAEYEGIGTDSPHSFIKFKNKMFGLFKSGFYLLSGTEELVSYNIEDVDTYPIGASDTSEAYAIFYPLRKEFVIVFPTDQTMYALDSVSGNWVVHSLGAAINSLTTGIDGELYGASSTKIFRIDNGTTDDGTAINPQWMSKVYSMGSEEGVLKELEITYKSNTAIQFDVYIDRGSAASWAGSTDNQLAAATTATTKRLLFPSNFRGNQFEFGITIPSTLRATNTYVEVYQIDISGIVEERIS